MWSASTISMPSEIRMTDDSELRSLPGLGPKSASWLSEIGIHSRSDLERAGAMTVFLRLQRHDIKPGLNMLYALVGAIEGRHWTEIARQEKSRLLTEMAAAEELSQRMPAPDQQD